MPDGSTFNSPKPVTTDEVREAFATVGRLIGTDDNVVTTVAGWLSTWSLDAAITAASAQGEFTDAGYLMAYRSALAEAADPELVLRRGETNAAEREGWAEKADREAVQWQETAEKIDAAQRPQCRADYEARAERARNFAAHCRTEAERFRRGAAEVYERLTAKEAA